MEGRVNKSYSIMAVSYLLTVFVLLASSGLGMAGGCGEGTGEAGKSVNPAEVREDSNEKPVRSLSAPNPYTEDVIRMKKKMQEPDTAPPKVDSDGKGTEVDKSQ
jgi:hypothetical protein